MIDKTEMVKTFIAEAIANDGNTTGIGAQGDIRLRKFKVYCKDCGGDNTLILTDFSYSQGSEFTGVYGEEVKLLFKCKECGSAERILNRGGDYID